MAQPSCWSRRRRALLDELASQIGSAGGSALAVEADITERAAAEEAVERAVSALGRLDILVNNAGVMLLGPAVESVADEWDRMLALNVQGTCTSRARRSRSSCAPPAIRRADSPTS